MQINIYRERLRVLLILYFFSEEYNDDRNKDVVLLFKSEVKIQKIDFLIRYPSYLCYELLRLHEETNFPDKPDVQKIVSHIFLSKEPQLRTDEMRRFFYGAYEELDEIISFLVSVNLVVFKSRKSVDLKDINKEYYLTSFAKSKIEKALLQIPGVQWYSDRCKLIKEYFNDLSGSEFKNRQYEIEVYRDTPLGNYINDIEIEVREKYSLLFNKNL